MQPFRTCLETRGYSSGVGSTGLAGEWCGLESTPNMSRLLTVATPFTPTTRRPISELRPKPCKQRASEHRQLKHTAAVTTGTVYGTHETVTVWQAGHLRVRSGLDDRAAAIHADAKAGASHALREGDHAHAILCLQLSSLHRGLRSLTVGVGVVTWWHGLHEVGVGRVSLPRSLPRSTTRQLCIPRLPFHVIL